jgi:alkanesulfonate monooxygenase SsuD/methylene tetrahydromethanopterin reductase-like flavin-dependent oxidoreductase (luciferase family)
MRYWVQLATEQFPPSSVIEQAVQAERAGFDAINVSDHFQPWWEPGESGMAWALLGAIGQGTERVGVGTGVTAAVHRYHPAVVAQFAATMEETSGYVSAFGPDAAGVAARRGDGLWTLADAQAAPGLIEAYRAACDDAGKQPGEIILQSGFSWAEDDDAALEGARVWKPTQLDEFYTDDWHDPKAMYEKAENELSDESFMESYIVGSDLEHHRERIRQIEELGATVVCLQNGSGADSLGALRAYGEHVLN